MEAERRPSALGSSIRQRILVLLGAAAITAVTFGILFELLARLTNWVLRSGFDRFGRLSPTMRIASSILPVLFILFAGSFAGFRRNRQRRRLEAHRRRPDW
jgi:hypothetical protein